MIHFDTFYFDDKVKIEVYQKESLLKSNMVGKANLELRSVSYCKKLSIIGVPIVNKAQNSRIVGYLYMKISYIPR